MNPEINPDDLLDEARDVATRSYSPYSRFRVGAVVVADDGRTFHGVNVENAAFGATICAEGTAISSAIAAGVDQIDTIAVAGLDADECYPCGNCRQLMREFQIRRIIVQDPAGGHREHYLEELLPHAFGPDELANES